MYTVILKKKRRTKLCIILLLFDFILLPSLHISFTSVQKGNPEQAHRSTKVVTIVHNQPRKTRDKHNHRRTTEEDKDIL